MARGWESKSVEAQMESAAERRAEANPQRDAEQMERERKRDGLLLQRKRVLGELERCQDERYRKTLAGGLAYLEDQLAAFDALV